MNKGSNSKTNTSSKKKSKTNKIFEITKTKRPKNRKNSIEPENAFLSYNLHEKKNTSLKKIFLYHEISDKLKSNYFSNEENLNAKNKNLLEKNYTIKCIFLDRHVKSYTKSEKNCELTLDLIEKEEKSKIIDLYLIKSDLISEDHKSNNSNSNNLNQNFLNRKTLSNSNNNFNSTQNPNKVNLNCKKDLIGISTNVNANSVGLSNLQNINNCNDPVNCNSLSGNFNSTAINTNNNQNVNQELKNNINLNNNYRKIFKQKFLNEISNYVDSITLISPSTTAIIYNYSNNTNPNNNNINNKLAPSSNTENSNLSSDNMRKNSLQKNTNCNLINTKNPLLNSSNNNNLDKREKRDFKNFFMHFIQYFPQDFDCFEHEVVKILSSKMVFSDFSNIFLFLYDDLKKLRDQKTIELLKNKLKENVNEDLSILRMELKNFYEFRSSIINDFLGKSPETSEWTDERILNEIFLTSLISEKLKNTNELDLTQNYIMGKNIQMIMSALKFNSFIWKIVLNSNKIGEEGMFLLGRVLHYNNKITDLDISLNFLTDKAIGLFVKGIDNTLVNLQRLNLSNNNGLTHFSGERFKEILILAPNLKTLNISRINLEKGILKVFEGLLFNQNLEELICIYTQLNDEILLEIGRFFMENNELIKLKKLNLSDNKFSGPSGPREFFGALAYNTHLKEIIMYNCKMDNTAFESFCKMIKINNCLEKVSFYNNDFNSMENLKKILRIKKLNHIVKNSEKQIQGNLNNFEFENIKSGGLLNKTNIEKQVSFLTMNKVEECTFQDNQSKSNIGNNNSLYLPGNSLGINKEINDVFGFWNTENDGDKTLEDNSNDYKRKNNFTTNFNFEDTNTNNAFNTDMEQKSYKIIDSDLNEKTNKYVQNKNLLNLDISKNKIKLVIDDEFLDLIKNSHLQELDLSGHYDLESMNSNTEFLNFKDFLRKLKNIKVHV